jgi:putative transposase
VADQRAVPGAARERVWLAGTASYEFNSVLKECGITPSMSGKGNCWDNACSETLFGSLKVERLHGEHFETFRQAKDETLDWLLWYNRMCTGICG